MMLRCCLIYCLVLTSIGLNGQGNACEYYQVIRYIENDPEIKELIELTFSHRFKNKKQKYPSSFSVADSLTFINVNFAFKGNFDPALGVDSIVFNSIYDYANLYYHKNTPLLPKIPNPPSDQNPLNIFISKRIGNTIAIEITEDAKYPSNQIIRFGSSIVTVLLVDESNSVIKKLFAGVVNYN